jgi:hypothetical protein
MILKDGGTHELWIGHLPTWPNERCKSLLERLCHFLGFLNGGRHSQVKETFCSSHVRDTIFEISLSRTSKRRPLPLLVQAPRHLGQRTKRLDSPITRAWQGENHSNQICPKSPYHIWLRPICCLRTRSAVARQPLVFRLKKNIFSRRSRKPPNPYPTYT